jgi:predicted transport protein/predicted type IV restriction endonuclease
VGLPEAIPKLVQSLAALKASGSGNEPNTKALLIEPMIAALGWDPVDLRAVEREVKVFEGTFLDYALKLAGKPRIYIEAKGLSENLDDKKFIAQTVNYANNDGVVWCVLTNGRRVRVYKTNEPVAMDRKLLFEVDLADESETPGDKAKLLRLISRESVERGDLDRFGERVFTDGRVRKALADLATEPPQALLDVLTRRLGHPAVPIDAVKRSLARILDAPAPKTGSPPDGAASTTPPLASPGPPSPPKGQEYVLDHHLEGKSALITDLFDEINAFATSLGGDVTRRIRKQYIGYFRGKRSFVTLELQHQRALVYLALDPAKVQPWNDEVMRNVRSIGHFGMGDTEYSLRNVDQFDELKALIQAAYDARA